MGIILKSVVLFFIVGICEIRGGWLIWKWLREGRPMWWGLIGGILLVLYGIVATLQPSPFSRVYAVYGGVFIAMSLLWGWRIGGQRPDRADTFGAMLAVIGVAIMMYWPRAPHGPSHHHAETLTVNLSN
jgi:small multidrug resistance family-3 protein